MGGELGKGMGAQLLFLSRSPRPEHHGYRHILAKGGVGHGEGQGLLHGRMPQERLIHAAWNHLLPAPIDHFLQAARQGEPPLAIQQALIAGEKPRFSTGIVHPAAVIGGLIARGHIAPTNGHLAALSSQKLAPVGPQHHHLGPRRCTHAPGLAASA